MLAFAGTMHACPGPKSSWPHDRHTMGRLQAKCRVSRMRQTGEASQRFRTDKFRFTPQLHAADHCREVDVATTFSGAQKRTLYLDRSAEDRCAAVRDSQAAIGVAVKSELCRIEAD